MKPKLFLTAILLTISTSVQAQQMPKLPRDIHPPSGQWGHGWDMEYRNGTPPSVTYIDLRYKIENGNLRKVWLYRAYQWPLNRVKSELNLSTINCNLPYTQLSYIVKFDVNGRAIYNAPNNANPVRISPGTNAELLRDLVCS